MGEIRLPGLATGIDTDGDGFLSKEEMDAMGGRGGRGNRGNRTPKRIPTRLVCSGLRLKNSRVWASKMGMRGL